jgi:hypothetical protein
MVGEKAGEKKQEDWEHKKYGEEEEEDECMGDIRTVNSSTGKQKLPRTPRVT